jgi:hypothetical protein
VLPRDQDPGALDFGVPEYIDRAIQDPDEKNRLAVVRKSLFMINKRHTETRGRPFAGADTAGQAEFFRTWIAEGGRNTEFLQHLVDLTIEGSFADPSYGGNKGEAGWRFLGYKPDPCRTGYTSLRIHKG